MLELADEEDSKSFGSDTVRVLGHDAAGVRR